MPISSDDSLMPDVKMINNYIKVLEFVAASVQSDCNLSLMGEKFFNQLLAVQGEIRNLRAIYINSLKFQSYE